MINKIARRTTLLALSATAFALSSTASANLDEQFSLCAAKAIASKQLVAKKFSVNLPTDNLEEMDHDASPIASEYIMQLINPSSGEGLGRVSCRVDSQGEVESVTYLSQR